LFFIRWFETAMTLFLYKNILVLIPRVFRKSFGERGMAAVEFALVAPMLMLAIVGICQFGITMNQYLTLADSVRTGARQFALSRGDSTPYTDTINLMYSSAPQLTEASLTITLSVNGTACASDSACGSALTAGVPSTVAATYPCSLAVYGYNFAPSCTLVAQTTERVE